MSENLPETWLKTTLGNVVEYNSAEKVSPKNISKYAWVLGLEDIEKDTSKLLRKVLFVDIKSKSTKARFSKGDVLYGKLRPYLNKVLIADQDGYCTTEILPLKPSSAITSKFLYYNLRRPEFLDYVNQISHGIQMPRLGTDAGKNAPIILAPVPEQKRIAAKVDSLLASVDACKARLDKVPEILKRFRQSVLSDATSGKLTEDWREDNPKSRIDKLSISELHKKRITEYEKNCEASKAKIQKKTKVPTNIDKKFCMDRNVLETMQRIPAEWQYVHIAFITDNKPDSIVDGPFGSSIRVKEDYVESGVPVVRINNISPFKFISRELKYLRASKFQHLRRHNLMPGDVLFGKVGTIGNSCIYPDNMDEGMLSTTGSCRIRTDKSICTDKFLCLVLNACKPVFNRIASAGLQPFLNMKTIKNFPVPLPHLDEQKEIIRRVETLFSVADQLVKKLTLARKRVDNLTASILSKAFRGKLVPQDPKDEPAEKLLERIRAERESLGAGTKKGSRTTQKKSAQTEKGKTSSADLVKEPQPATAVGPSKTKAIAPNADPKKTTPSKAERQIDEFEVPQAFRKAIFRKNGIDEAILLKLAGERLGIENLTHETRKELAPYIDTALQRKILCRKGDGFSSGAPTIQRYDDEFLMKVVETVIENGYEYQADHLINESANYLGFERVSDAFKKRMNSVLDMAVRKKVLYRKDAYLGKVE